MEVLLLLLLLLLLFGAGIALKVAFWVIIVAIVVTLLGGLPLIRR